VRVRDISNPDNNLFTEKSISMLTSEYNVFGMGLDSTDRCWIHDGHTNQLIGFDKDLREKAIFEGICFNRNMWLIAECGFASTDATFTTSNRQKMFWHKGKGILSAILFGEEKEVEYADTISDSVYTRKIEATETEEFLVCLDSDFATFHIYDLKKQHRFGTWVYKNEQLVEPKAFSFTLSKNDKYIVIGGDHQYKGDDKKRKREAFLSLHKLNPSFELVATVKIPDIDTQLVTMCKDPESGIVFAADYSKNLLVCRTVDEKLSVIQVLKDVHVDYAFSMSSHDNRLYTCSLTQKLSAVEFTSA